MPANQEDKDTVTYELRRRGKVVYIGTTNNPKRREAEHRNEGKIFDELVVTSGPMTAEDATQQEALNLFIYQLEHDDENPLYNETDDG